MQCLGFKEITPKKMIRLPDRILKELEAHTGDFIVFLQDGDRIYITKTEEEELNNYLIAKE